MIRLDKSHGLQILVVEPALYFDQCVIQNFAQDLTRCKRLIQALEAKNGTLYFSGLNLLEISALNTQLCTYQHIGNFVDAVGEHFTLINIDFGEVIRQEKGEIVKILPPPIDEDLTRALVQNLQPGSIVTFRNLFRQFENDVAEREKMKKLKIKLDEKMKAEFDEKQELYKSNPSVRANVDNFKFTPTVAGKAPTKAILERLNNYLIRSGEEFKRNDGADYFHSIVATSYSTYVMLDTKWVPRLRDKIQLPVGAARIYSVTELDQFLDDFEK